MRALVCVAAAVVFAAGMILDTGALLRLGWLGLRFGVAALPGWVLVAACAAAVAAAACWLQARPAPVRAPAKRAACPAAKRAALAKRKATGKRKAAGKRAAPTGRRKPRVRSGLSPAR